MSKINVLDDNTINQIAAGEVVERPYSIVKELVENSIDALSTNITIEIRKGGKSLIRVTDNGVGIESDDVKSAFLRHSTSKIHKADDLQNIMTLGFRGEALASIASISQVDMVSKTRSSDLGRRLVIHGGDIQEDRQVGTSNGTTIIVKNVFYNVPVRKKFLKTDLAESSAISDLIYKLAMSNPSISFKYIKDGVTSIKTPGSDNLEETIYALFGKELIESTEVLKECKSKLLISVRGRISKSTYSRGNRSKQYIFVNGRSVRSLLISKCIERVYGDLIPQSRFPVFMLFIELDPQYIDVNIHPSKTEIRFLREQELVDLIEKSVKTTLAGESSIVDMGIFKDETSNITPAKKSPLGKQGERDPSNSIDPSEKALGDPTSKASALYERPSLLDPKHLGPRELKGESQARKKHDLHHYHGKPALKDRGLKRDLDRIPTFSNSTDKVVVAESQTSLEQVGELYNQAREPASKGDRFPELRLIGKLFENYILAEDISQKELIIVDQHAAHERIMYESLKREISSQKVCRQEMLSPEPIGLSLGDYEKYMDFKDLFSDMGFEIEDFGQNTILIRGVPMILGKPSSSDFFLDILDKLGDKISGAYQFKLDKLMKLACSSAIKSGDRTDSLEDSHLLKQLKECDYPYTCPHGRPTIMKLSKSEIEKKFKRR